MEETLEEASWKYNPLKKLDGEFIRAAFIAGAKWQSERMYGEEDMISFAEFVATYTDKNRNVHGQMLHAKSKYDEANRTVDLLEQYYNETYGK
jgi:hypothetical protein